MGLFLSAKPARRWASTRQQKNHLPSLTFTASPSTGTSAISAASKAGKPEGTELIKLGATTGQLPEIRCASEG